MPDRTILTEATEALVTADRVDDRTCPDRLLDILRPGCRECEREAQELAAVVLRVAEKRLREQVGDPPEPVMASNGADFARLGMHAAADLIAEGLPAEMEANR